MPSFSKTSLDRLGTCDNRLQLVLTTVIKHFDCKVIEGHRGKDLQTEFFETGRSQVEFPDSKHNTSPSRAVDVAPWPIDWNDRDRFHYFAGVVIATGRSLGVELRWGGDWDRDTEVRDNGFDDLVHFELVDDR